jgi:hypothetical protein
MNQDLFAKYGTLLKLVGVVFVGIHVPLILGMAVWLSGQSEPSRIMLTVLIGTVAGLLISVSGIVAILRNRGLVPV